MWKWSFYGFIALLVMGVTANLFANNGAGYGLPMPDEVYYGVIALALLVPLFWALVHMGMALIMGISGGGLKEGLKLGLLLGLGMALGRSWLNVAAIGAGIFIGNGPLAWVVLALVVAAVLFALDWGMHYIWRTHREAPNS
jgi:hypothetical protein